MSSRTLEPIEEERGGDGWNGSSQIRQFRKDVLAARHAHSNRADKAERKARDFLSPRVPWAIALFRVETIRNRRKSVRFVESLVRFSAVSHGATDSRSEPLVP